MPLSSLQFPATSMQCRSIGDHQTIPQTTSLFKPQTPSPPSQQIDACVEGANLSRNVAWSTPSLKDHTILSPSISPLQCLFTTSLSQLEIPTTPMSPPQHHLSAPLSQLDIPAPPISPLHHHLTVLLSCLDIPAPLSSPLQHHFIAPVSHLNIPAPPFQRTPMPLTPQPMVDLEDSSGGQAMDWEEMHKYHQLFTHALTIDGFIFKFKMNVVAHPQPLPTYSGHLAVTILPM